MIFNGLAVRFLIRRMLKLKKDKHPKNRVETIHVHVLANSNVSNLTLFNHLLQFLPGWIWILSEFEINVVVFSIIFEGNGPISQ